MEELKEKIEKLFKDKIISFEQKEMPVITTKKEIIEGLIRYLKEEEKFSMLLDITAVDYLKWHEKKEKRFEVVYHLFSLEYNRRIRIKVPLGEEEGILSMTSLFKNANWLEREVYDMFGIHFIAHPDLRRILMYDEFEGYPLRKDYPLKKRQPRLEGLED